ncbi:YciI family protein [Sinomonas flava]|uniref:YciI family protein n=1 Tax=Sinomonas flava TaxID=496857 RepID=A0ABP5NVQ5_9MICC
MALFAVTYRYTANPSGRDLHRPEHVAFLAAQYEARRLIVSGPTDGGAGALLILAGATADDVEGLLDADPFCREGLIARRTVTAWKPFFGADRLELSEAAR